MLRPEYRLASERRRSTRTIGVITPETGGFGEDAFGEQGGRYLTRLVAGFRMPLASRWGHILLRRALLDKVTSPANVDPADWTAARAWRLLRMGEADAARALVLEVDSGNYSPYLYDVAMQAHLATADPAGICPLVPGGARESDEPTWDVFRAICASLSGEQSRATQLLRTARRDGQASGIDYLLAEKLVGAGFEGRRAVRIDWDGVENFNAWRFGLGLATGVEPPANLFEDAGRHVQGWRARAPMLLPAARMDAADTAAALGVLSSEAMVDLYSEAYIDEEAGGDTKQRAATLRTAYIAPSAEERVEAMRDLWQRKSGYLGGYSAKVLTARAAARIPPSPARVDDAGDLLTSMLTAGLDRNAARWARVVEPGSLGWALVAIAAPEPALDVDYGALDDFGDADDSSGRRRSAFLVAGLAGLGRVSAEDANEFAGDLDVTLGGDTRWTRAISRAAARGQRGTTSLLAALGLQGRSWASVSPRHLYHVTRALRQVGLEPEARMIAAEAVARS